jgi:hypothetical protein
MSGEKFTRLVEIIPAYDKRDKDPKKNYGIHGCTLRMVLSGPEGAVQFVLFTNWHLPHVAKENRKYALTHVLRAPFEADSLLHAVFEPLPADLGYHSLKPMYEDQMEGQKSCPYLGGKPCYYDGSGLQAERIYETMLEKGSDGVWTELEGYYEATFKRKGG